MRFFLTAISLFASFFANSQVQITGIVKSSDGVPAGHVNVEIRGSNQQTITDNEGMFHLNLTQPGKYRIVLSHSGLETLERTIEIAGTQASTFTFELREDAQELAEVIISSKKGLNARRVSAGKIQLDPMDIPQSVTVVGQSLMREQQSQRLGDVIKNVNGVYLATTRGNVQESFSARGYAFSSSNMFKNGARVNTGTMPEISSLEKVEILKGSAAILYGNVAPGGIINMVTKQPKFERGAEISFRTGSYGLIKPAIDVYGPLTKNIAARLNGTYEKASSFRNGVQSERFYINPSFLFHLGKKTELVLQGDHLDHKFTPDFGIGSLDNTRIAPVSRSSFFGTSWQYNKAKQSTATASLRHKLNNSWSVNASGSFQAFRRDYYAVERIQAAANGDWARPLNKIQSGEDYVIGQLDVTGKFKTGGISHELLAGVDADRYLTKTYAFNNPTTYDTINILDDKKFTQRSDIPTATKVTRVETPINRVGAYVQDLVHLSSKIKVLAGIRWSQQRSFPATTTYLLKDSIAKGLSKYDKAFSPRVGLVYRPTKTVSLFASYANSFSINNGTDVFGNALPASIIDQYELGVKNDLIKGKLSANITVYRIINNNLAQTAQFAADGVTPNNNTALKELAGETTSDGVEIDLSSQPLAGLDLIAGYSYNNMRYTRTKQAKGNYIEGERLVNTPAHTANASANYQLLEGNLKGLKFGAAFYYTGDRFGGWNNTQQQAQNYSRLIKVKNFNTVDISAGYCFKKMQVIAKVSNLFNTYNYYVHENYSINPIAPRQFISTISYRF